MSVEVKVNEWMELVGRKLFSIESVPKDVAVKMVYRCAKAVADKAENLEAAHAREVRRLREALDGRWISVEERYPDDKQQVLFVVASMDESYSGTVQAGRFTIENYGGDTYHTFSFPGRGTSATHWMPLPEPPAALAADQGETAKSVAEDIATCLWVEEDRGDGAMFTTGCGNRVEPAPGLQTHCHCCGRRLDVTWQGETEEGQDESRSDS